MPGAVSYTGFSHRNATVNHGQWWNAKSTDNVRPHTGYSQMSEKKIMQDSLLVWERSLSSLFSS
jgi:hypothetical protein